MGYHLIDPTDVEPLGDRAADARSISETAGLEILGLRVYQAKPGQQIPLRYHYHDEQEEAFYVLEGELHVETPTEDFVVQPGQFFVVEPGNAHRAHNPDSATSAVRVIAMGAPSLMDAHEYTDE